MADRIGEWMWNIRRNCPAKIIALEQLWGREAAQCWLPTLNSTEAISTISLKPITDAPMPPLPEILTIIASTRIHYALQNDPYATLFKADLLPLPHQLKALHKATDTARTRFLLADEVGLGKTIEAGMIHSELKRRGLVKRTLIIAPRGLTRQWVDELKTRFNETFYLVNPTDPASPQDDNPWKRIDQAVSSLDSVKPVISRNGWTDDQLTDHNQRRFLNLIEAEWDLVIVDEAHKLPGSTQGGARYELATAISNSTPYLLLLSATPHQGKTDQFHRLIQLLDPTVFTDDTPVTKESIQPYIIRTEKRQAITPDGEPLFTPRSTQLIPVSWSEEHYHQRQLYQETTEYIREGYNKALEEKRNYIGFLMALMQKLVSSSTRAISETLTKRLQALEDKEPAYEPSEDSEPGQQRLDEMIIRLNAGLKDEHEQVRHLTELANECESEGPDARAEALLDLIHKLRTEENDSHLKILIFTEFLPTQRMLNEFLTVRGLNVTLINGSMSLEERLEAQRSFAVPADVLISTEAGGEGINLQFCHVVINYDLPWNPMRIEQRIGRIDRIGQKHPVLVFNLTFNNSIEHRIQEILEYKLKIILHEFGVDKLGDVLDSSDIEADYDKLYMDTLLHPETLEDNVDIYLSKLRQRAKPELTGKELIRSWEPLDIEEATRIINNPLRNWMERLTTLNANTANSTLKISKQNPIYIPGMPIPVITLKHITAEVTGFWSLWRLTASNDVDSTESIYPVFIHDDGRVLTPTANQLWDALLRLETEPELIDKFRENTAETIYKKHREEAEKRGNELLSDMETSLQREKTRRLEKVRILHILQRESLGDIDTKRHIKLAPNLDTDKKNLKQQGIEDPLIQLQSLIIIHVRRANG